MTLVVMAAGLGSRYGGCKQIDGVGPGGEILMEYSVYDAVRAGFDKIVFIIKEEMEAVCRPIFAGAMADLRTPEGKKVEIKTVFQDNSSLPAFFTPAAGRVKPLGTVHAVLCAREAVTEPFAVINADDFYGAGAFVTMKNALEKLRPEGEGCMVSYLLKNTVSPFGGVTRGVCRAENGLLAAVSETYKITLMPDGSIVSDPEGEARVLDGEALVSMNFWGYTPWIFGEMERYFNDFLRALAPDDVKSECLLPVMTDAMIKSGAMKVSVLQTGEKWFGMTYAEDRADAARKLREKHEAGQYPASLRR